MLVLNRISLALQIKKKKKKSVLKINYRLDWLIRLWGDGTKEPSDDIGKVKQICRKIAGQISFGRGCTVGLRVVPTIHSNGCLPMEVLPCNSTATVLVLRSLTESSWPWRYIIIYTFQFEAYTMEQCPFHLLWGFQLYKLHREIIFTVTRIVVLQLSCSNTTRSL